MTYSRKKGLFLLTGAAVAVALLAGCAGYTAKLATITVAPDARLSERGSHQFLAEGRDARGSVFRITPVWTAASGGTIDSNGLFTAGTAPGTYANAVAATDGSISGTASVVVLGPPTPALATIALTPAGPDTIVAGQSIRFLAAGTDSTGHLLPFSPNWSVVAGGGRIDEAGLFTADTLLGTYRNTVKADYAGIVAYATLTVMPSPAALLVADSAASNGTMRAVVHFEYDKSDLTDDTRAALNDKVKVFQAHPDMRIRIVGHTDRRGTGAYNLALGTRRAESVRDYLVTQGVAADRIEIRTRGEKDPVASGDSEPAMALNRRDAFWILAGSDTLSRK